MYWMALSACTRGKLKMRGISLGISVDDSVPNYVDADPTRLRQVLNNLVSNALKFTSKGSGNIRCEMLEMKEDAVRLRRLVLDTRIGIPEGRQATILEAFGQADVSTTREYGGTGLGLSIVTRLVSLLGPACTWRARWGKGAGSALHSSSRSLSHPPS